MTSNISYAEEATHLPVLILFSLSSLVHSLTLIQSTPPFRKYIRHQLIGKKAN